MYGETYDVSLIPHERQGAPIWQLVTIAACCVTLGFLGSQVMYTQLIHPVARNTVVGAAMASVLAGNTVPTYAVQSLGTTVSTDTHIQTIPIRPQGHVIAQVAEAPALADSELTDSDKIQLVIMAALIPVLGYASWQFGARKAKENVASAKTNFEKDLEAGKFMKVSPSGIPTVKGFPMASDAGWKIQADELKARGIKGINGQELMELIKSGATVVDVRSREKYEQGAIPGSVNVPLFQPITGWTPFKVARRVQFAAFGVAGTEYNTDFMKEFDEKVGTSPTKLVFVDDSVRGTLNPTIAFPDGKTSHALMSVYLTSSAGYQSQMQYLEGGILAYCSAGGDLVEATN